MYFINTFLTLLEHAGTHTPVSLKLIFYLISFLKCWQRRREKKVVKNLNRFFSLYFVTSLREATDLTGSPCPYTNEKYPAHSSPPQ